MINTNLCTLNSDLVGFQFALAPFGVEFPEHGEGGDHRHNNWQKQWNVNGVLLLIREVQLGQETGIEEGLFRGHKGPLGQGGGFIQPVTGQGLLGQQDVLIGQVDGRSNLIIYHNIANVI